MTNLNFDILIDEELIKSLGQKKLKRTRFLFTIIGFCLGTLVSILSMISEDLTHHNPIFSDLWHTNHLITPFFLGIIGSFFGAIIDRRSKKLNDIYLALFESQQSLSIITDNLPVLISYVDSNLKYRFTNKTYKIKYNFSSKDIYGKHVKEIVGNEYYAIIENYFKQALAGNIVNFESTRSFFDTKSAYSKNAFIPHFDPDNKVIGVFIIITDITELRLREDIIKNQNAELIKGNATKDKFISIISHDLKNPFNGLLGFSNILLSDFYTIKDEDKIQMISTIRQLSEQTYKLLQDLLDWARMQTGSFQYLPTEFVLSDCLMEEYLFHQELVKQKDLTIEFQANNDIVVWADRNMISAVVRNLLSNAIKFTQPKGVISMGISKDDQFAIVTVKDTGVGISEENLNKLFHVNGNKKTFGTNNEEGTGLGLILCKEFVIKNGGDIVVESRIGEGSQIKFTLPLKI